MDCVALELTLIHSLGVLGIARSWRGDCQGSEVDHIACTLTLTHESTLMYQPWVQTGGVLRGLCCLHCLGWLSSRNDLVFTLIGVGAGLTDVTDLHIVQVISRRRCCPVVALHCDVVRRRVLCKKKEEKDGECIQISMSVVRDGDRTLDVGEDCANYGDFEEFGQHV